jgi:uncharacterized protein YceH (UPF0502 family)
VTNPKDNANANAEKEDVTPRVAALELRVTALETMLAQKIPGFETVAGRVTELSGAFQNANIRLTSLEATVAAIQEQAPPPSEQRLAAIEASVAALSAQVGTLAATRARTGLSGRLRSIEDKLDQLLPPAPPGGTQ